MNPFQAITNRAAAIKRNSDAQTAITAAQTKLAGQIATAHMQHRPELLAKNEWLKRVRKLREGDKIYFLGYEGLAAGVETVQYITADSTCACGVGIVTDLHNNTPWDAHWFRALRRGEK